MMECLLTTKEAALLLGKSEAWLCQQRHERRGIPFVKFPTGQIKYLYSDLLAVIEKANQGGGDV